MTENERRLLQMIIETSYLYSPEPKFPLSSGVMSNYYLDCKMVLSYAEARKRIGELLFDRIRNTPINAVGGLALGAYPISIVLSDIAYAHGRNITAFVVRQEPKSHGLKKYIEGDVKGGDKVLIVDDVITTGKSVIEAIGKCREAGLEVVNAIAIVDREEYNGKKNIEDCGVPFEALFTIKQLRNFKG